jgi:hypothetical protein
MPGHELYVYYRLLPDQAAAAVLEIQQLQQSLRLQLPGLQTQCLARVEMAQQSQTWMEIYRHPEGLCDAAQALIEAAGQGWPKARMGPRHTEVFDALPTAD